MTGLVLTRGELGCWLVFAMVVLAAVGAVMVALERRGGV